MFLSLVGFRASASRERMGPPSDGKASPGWHRDCSVTRKHLHALQLVLARDSLELDEGHFDEEGRSDTVRSAHLVSAHPLRCRGCSVGVCFDTRSYPSRGPHSDPDPAPHPDPDSAPDPNPTPEPNPDPDPHPDPDP